MDGLLLDSELVYRRIWQAAGREFGYEISDQMHAQFLGRGRKWAMEYVAEVFGGEFPGAQFSKRLSELEAQYFAENVIEPKPGAVKLVSDLHERNVPLAVATSTKTAAAQQRLGNSGLLEYFRVVIGGDQVSRGKPDPEIFLTTAAKLSVAPEDCLVLEDSESGAEAALAAGMTCFLVPDLKAPSPEMRARLGRIFNSLLEVGEELMH